jgi:HNH endonuclease
MTLTHEQLREALEYNAETGQLIWRSKLPISSANKGWNQRYANTVAGCLHGNGYMQVRLDGSCFQAHRLIWFLVTGHWPVKQIDHIDRNRANNAWGNLRLASRQQNSYNSATVLGAVGIRLTRSGTWQARTHGKYLGVFKTPEEALAVRRKYITDAYGEYLPK